MAEPASNLFDPEDLDTKERALAEAQAQLDAGQGVPHESVCEWLKELAAGRRTSSPRA